MSRSISKVTEELGLEEGELVREMILKAFANGSAGRITIEGGGIVRRPRFLPSWLSNPERLGVLLEKDGSKLQINHGRYYPSGIMYSTLYREITGENPEISLFPYAKIGGE